MLMRFVPRSVVQQLERVITATVRREVDRLPHALTDTDVQLRQLQNLIEREQRLPPPPPKHLQVRVVGGYSPQFFESGYRVVAEFNAALAPMGKTLGDFPRMLDFGCGCGRVIRAMHTCLPQADLVGTDIDPEAIHWLQTNYQSIGRFVLAPHTPPLPLPDGAVDFVYGISVFTHLPEDLQFRWLEELRRVTTAGGTLILTTHAEQYWSRVPSHLRTAAQAKGFFYASPDTVAGSASYGHSVGLPEFYQTAYHTHDYIRREWSRYFTVVDVIPLGLESHQDIVLLRNERCSSLKYGQYSHSSRLVSRAHHRPRCSPDFHHGLRSCARRAGLSGDDARGALRLDPALACGRAARQRAESVQRGGVLSHG
jgi:SAM-dependent methyltransferase